MSKKDNVLPYEQALFWLGNGRKHILLGNGFSIACDPIFSYSRLYDAALEAGLSDRAQKVFERLGTNNFEGVMRLLDDAHWVAETYNLISSGHSDMLADVDVVKKTLVQAVAHSHLEHTGKVAEPRKRRALAFLDPYHNIFTTNYDLLAYWVNMHSSGRPAWGDGFRADESDPDLPYVIFSERLGDQRGLFYIHGALHLYVANGELRKHTWSRTGKPLTQLIQAGLAQKQYPLFVAEGTPEGKLEQIQRNGYLWYCLDKLAKISSPLAIFGHSLGDSDQHIADLISDNPKLSKVAIGLHGNLGSKANGEIRASAARMIARREDLVKQTKSAKRLEVSFYDSASARVWD